MEHLCVLSPDSCEHQVTKPTQGGRHVAICTCPEKKCIFHAEDYLPKEQEKEEAEIDNACVVS